MVSCRRFISAHKRGLFGDPVGTGRKEGTNSGH